MITEVQPDSRRSFQPSTPAPLSRLRAISNPNGYSYLVSRPRSFAADPNRRWPLIFFLHGVAERGVDPMDITRKGLPRLLARGPDLAGAELGLGEEISERFVVVAPQCPHYEIWEEPRLLQLLDTVITGNSIDAARVFLTGLSMGGFGTWTLGLRHPQRFAAIVPVCGGGRIADVAAGSSSEPFRKLRVWAFHGAGDRVVPLDESARMVDEVKRAGVGEVKFTVYPEGGHDAWTATYANPELYRWLLERAR